MTGISLTTSRSSIKQLDYELEISIARIEIESE